MSIDERLEAITMNLELATRDIQDLREGIGSLREGIHELSRGLAEMKMEGTAQRERIDILVTSTANLLGVSQSHESRLQRLERKSA